MTFRDRFLTPKVARAQNGSVERCGRSAEGEKNGDHSLTKRICCSPMLSM